MTSALVALWSNEEEDCEALHQKVHRNKFQKRNILLRTVKMRIREMLPLLHEDIKKIHRGFLVRMTGADVNVWMPFLMVDLMYNGC